MTDEELAELERLEKAATEAPWCWDNRGEKCNDIQIGTACTEPDGKLIAGYFDEENVTYLDAVAEATNVADARLVVALRNAAPRLLAELRRLRSTEGAVRL